MWNGLHERILKICKTCKLKPAIFRLKITIRDKKLYKILGRVLRLEEIVSVHQSEKDEQDKVESQTQWKNSMVMLQRKLLLHLHLWIREDQPLELWTRLQFIIKLLHRFIQADLSLLVRYLGPHQNSLAIKATKSCKTFSRRELRDLLNHESNLGKQSWMRQFSLSQLFLRKSWIRLLAKVGQKQKSWKLKKTRVS